MGEARRERDELAGRLQRHEQRAREEEARLEELGKGMEELRRDMEERDRESRRELEARERECARLKADLDELHVDHQRGAAELAASREEARRAGVDCAELRGQRAGAQREAEALAAQVRPQALRAVFLESPWLDSIGLAVVRVVLALAAQVRWQALRAFFLRSPSQ